jgi:hypothetical protein
MQLSAKGYLLIKDAKEFSDVAYSEYIAALVALGGRGYDSMLHIPFHFSFGFPFSATM